MNPSTRRQALKWMRALGERVVRAERMLDTGDELDAVRALAEARRLGGRVTAALLSDCLQAAWSDARSRDRLTRERCLDELVRLIDFAWTALCPACRRRVASGLRDRRRP